MVFFVGLACLFAMDPSAARIVQSTARVYYRKVPVTYWINLFSYFLRRGKSHPLRHIAFLLHSLVFCVDVVDIMVFLGHYVGTGLGFPSRSLAWIHESSIFCSHSKKS